MNLPELFDLIFKNKERQFDKQRRMLLEWTLDLDDGFVKMLNDKKQSQFSAVVLSLKYLVQVQSDFYACKKLLKPFLFSPF